MLCRYLCQFTIKILSFLLNIFQSLLAPQFKYLTFFFSSAGNLTLIVLHLNLYLKFLTTDLTSRLQNLNTFVSLIFIDTLVLNGWLVDKQQFSFYQRRIGPSLWLFQVEKKRLFGRLFFCLRHIFLFYLDSVVCVRSNFRLKCFRLCLRLIQVYKFLI